MKWEKRSFSVGFRRVNSEVFLPPRASAMIYKTVFVKSVSESVSFFHGKSEKSVGEENEACWRWGGEGPSGELELSQKKKPIPPLILNVRRWSPVNFVKKIDGTNLQKIRHNFLF